MDRARRIGLGQGDEVAGGPEEIDRAIDDEGDWQTLERQVR
jgi:hypothetical protein